ncbi:large conductance mechanosensitive channel protein MscL [Pollutibacter soli]|uniref:large conductance mechanosensitive channel protein MscL n=1 Tax=Pollutibacter soli TaxID=3034157 RepID=UPI0030141169
MGFMKEFREFAVRGNVMDLAIGVIIGAAFNKIVTALVESIIMPIIGLLIGDTKKFSEWQIGVIKIGVLIQAALDFIIIAFVLFMLVKGLNRLKEKKADVPPPPAPPTKTEVLLEEIRNELRKK